MRKIYLIPCVVSMLGLASCGGEDSVSPETAQDLAPGVLSKASLETHLILGTANRLPEDLSQQVEAAGGVVTKAFPRVGIAIARATSPDFAQRISQLAEIRSVVPDLSIQWIDPSERERAYEHTGNPPNSGEADFLFDLQWGHDAIDAPEAWDSGATGSGVRVAVLDDGIDSDHPDIAPNLNVGLSTSFVPGETFEYVENFPGDPFSHGTHVSGTIAAARNAYGTIGVAPEAELVMIKVLESSTGSGFFSWIIEGILYAVDIEADIVNMSLGGAVPAHGIPGEIPAWAVAELKVFVDRVVTFAYQNGITVIVSGGNNGQNRNFDADLVRIPTDAANAITVSATGPRGWALDPGTNLDLPAYYTNTGQSSIDLAAPGGNLDFDLLDDPGQLCTIVVQRPCFVFDLVFSTGSAGGWYWSAGTSMAAPHVSGVAALIVGQNGGSLPPQHVFSKLRSSADDLGMPGRDAVYGHGRVNAQRAVGP